tara:strand:- start:47 stop:1153 length:1107 start_codon:yes stop_codon:yes gene_type:complete
MRKKPLNPNCMAVIMENFKHYVAESVQTQDCGPLYIFENDNIREISFYDRLNILTESEDDIAIFVEQWEKSANYQLQQLNEAEGDDYFRKLGLSDEDIAIYQDMRQNPPATANMTPEQRRVIGLVGKAQKISSPILYLSTQAFMMIDKFKDKIIKYAGTIVGIINKIQTMAEKFKEKQPTLYKVGVFGGKVAIALVVVYAISNIAGSGEAMAGELTGGSPQSEWTIANKEQLTTIGQVLVQKSSSPDSVEIGKKMLEIAAGDVNVNWSDLGELDLKVREMAEGGVRALEKIEGAQAVAEAAAKAVENIPDTSQMFRGTGAMNTESALQALKAAAAAGDRESIQTLQQLAKGANTPEAQKMAAEILQGL